MITPEGVRIEVNSAGTWTAQQVYDLLKANAIQLNLIGPHFTVKVQDTYASQVTTAASSSDGVYTSFQATLYLKGVNSSFVTQPNASLAHEYGHVWSLYHLYLSQNEDWSSYLTARGLAANPLLDSSYMWMRGEIIADDYRLLFGSPAAITERELHLNTQISDPRTVTGLQNFLRYSWTT